MWSFIIFGIVLVLFLCVALPLISKDIDKLFLNDYDNYKGYECHDKCEVIE